jgi:hypothetical protein
MIVSALPFIFWAIGIITNPILYIINAMVAVALFALTVYSRGDSTMEELTRRLHI